VLIVGRLSREKDHLSLLRAVRAIVREKTIHLIIVGEGPERQAIESAIREMDLVHNVTLTGQQPSAEPFYAIADLAVLASRSEGSPNALLEAMASEIPTVATTVGGIPEIVVDGESALLVPPDDANALASAMRRVLLDEPGLGLRLSARARQLVLERHTPEQRVRKLVGIYRSVMDGKPAIAEKDAR
jgi:glycosyltransferase involved in cell wall biosynthesis